jgi:hypothetical protein
VEVELVRPAGLDDPAFPHQGDAVGHEHGFLGVVRHHQRRDAAGLEHVEGVVAHLVAEAGVEGGEGLVQKERLRAGRQGAGQRHPLLLPAGEHVGVSAGVGFEADAGEGFGHLPAALAARHAAEAEGDVLRHRQVREQGVVLEHETDPALFGRDFAARFGEHGAVQFDAAGLQGFQAGDEAEQGGLAVAGGAQEAQDLARPRLEVDAAEDFAFAVGVADAGQAEAHASL